MRKTLLFIAASFILNTYVFSQIKFEEGYYINNANQKITCLIKNLDWKNNPTDFEYRLTEESEVKGATIQTVSEFGVQEEIKYQRFKVDMDRSSNLTNQLSSQKEPTYKKENVFLKVLVAGNASLYAYQDTNLKRFFVSTTNRDIEQLVYKKYRVSTRSVAENNHYKQQLLNSLGCEKFAIDKFENIKYDEKDLIKLFIDYNQCDNSDFLVYNPKKGDLFNLSIRPGINYSSFSMDNLSSYVASIDFEKNLNFRIGVEIEYILPFNKSKWALLVEAAYNSYKSEIYDNYTTLTAELKSIDVPIGVRYYMFLNEDSKFFVNGSYATGFSMNSEIKGYFIDVSRISNYVALGLGYKYKKISVELRHDTAGDSFNHPYWVGNHQRFSAIMGYNIF